MSGMNFDPTAAAGYVSAAAEVSALLTTAADHAVTAAGSDLSGLGVLGAEFAAAWSSAVASQGETVRVAAQLIGAYGAVITTHGQAVTGIDADTTTALGSIGAEIEGAA